MNNIINMYKTLDLDKILRDINSLRSLYDKSVNIKNNITDESDYRNVMRAIELYMKNLVLSSNMLGDQRLENYKKVLNMAMTQDPTCVFESEVLNIPKERLMGIMSEEIYDKFTRYKGTVDKYCGVVYEKLMNNEDISIQDRHMLMNYLYSNIGTNNPTIRNMQENMVKRIMNEKDKYDYHDANFLVKFIASNEADEYGYEVVTNVSHITGSSKGANGYASEYKVYIDVDYILKSLNSDNKEDLAKVIHTICHEVAHTKQNDDILKGICNKDTLDILTDKIFRNELTKSDFGYYMSNYYFDAGEKDAERKGFLRADVYIQKYLNDDKEKKRISNYLYNKKDHEVYVDTISMRRDSSLEKVEADKFKIEKMEEILKRDNSYLTRFPQYKHLYNANGELKSFSDRLIAYTNFTKVNKEDSNDIFLSSFNYSLDKGDLSNIDFSKMSKEDFFKTIHALSDLYNVYSGMAHNTLESVRLNDNFLTEKNDIVNATDYRDKKVSLMASRYKKLESVLDVFYDKFGEEYASIEEFSYDKFIYEKDKNYARDKFSKIKAEREKNKKEIDVMLNENTSQSIEIEDVINK